MIFIKIDRFDLSISNNTNTHISVPYLREIFDFCLMIIPDVFIDFCTSVLNLSSLSDVVHIFKFSNVAR